MSDGARPLLVVLSGPSGVGKDAVLGLMKSVGGPMHFAVTATTRARRSREIDGVDYCFVPRESFEQLIEQGGLLEWAEVYGNFYGVPRAQEKEALEAGRDVMVKVDVQGAMTIKKAMPQAIMIFLAPPSMDELEGRLRRRKTESDTDLERRIATAAEEMEIQREFDYVVVNDEIERAVVEIQGIIAEEKRR